MAGGLDRRTPRSVRQAQAFRAVQAGSITGSAFVVTLVLAIAGVVSGVLPLLFLVLTALAVARFASVTGMRNRRS